MQNVAIPSTKLDKVFKKTNMVNLKRSRSMTRLALSNTWPGKYSRIIVTHTFFLLPNAEFTILVRDRINVSCTI